MDFGALTGGWLGGCSEICLVEGRKDGCWRFDFSISISITRHGARALPCAFRRAPSAAHAEPTARAAPIFEHSWCVFARTP